MVGAPSSQAAFRSASRALRTPVTVGIRREDPQRIWERRCPVTPDAVYELISTKGVEVQVEPCDRRVFPVQEFVKAGAKVATDIRESHIHVGIKETPLDRIISDPVAGPSNGAPVSRTHLMFSHTAKGQPYNTPLLARFLGSKNDANLLPRLIDYELLTNEKDGKRTVGFGWFAGVAGVLESLSAMAHSHLEIGIASPFLYTPRPHTLPSLEELRSALRSIGNKIVAEGTPGSLGPFVIGLTGTGNVAQGCLSMLAELPIENVQVKDLDALVKNPNTSLHKIYLVHAHPQDYFVTHDGHKYSRDHYYKHPELYRSTFAQDVAPYLTLFLNGTGWSPSFPRLMTNEQLTLALTRAANLGGARFTNVGDISCDVEGGLEFLTRSSTLSEPFYKVRPPNLPAHLPSVQMMAVDILPASIPLDASRHFSHALKPYLESLIDTYAGSALVTEHTRALDKASIAEHGRLRDKHQWLQQAVDKWRISDQNSKKATATASTSASNKAETINVKKKNVLMLGSGMVAGPAVDEIAKRKDVQLLIASNSLTEVERLRGSHSNVHFRMIDMSDQRTFEHLIRDADIVISLLPVSFHTTAAELCIQHRKHLVTASYISPNMRSLHHRAVEADVLLLNEIGLDPGIDHCSAISLISNLKARNRDIVSFTSFCGGLPAPEVPSVPLRYKFSWSPRGVLAAALNPAQYKLNNEVVNIKHTQLLQKYFPYVPITEQFELEGIANRDSVPYAETYQLGPLENIRTLLRGTLRYPGFSDLMQSFKAIGLLETTQKVTLNHWHALVPQALAIILKKQIRPEFSMTGLGALVPPSQVEPLNEALEWLSLVEPKKIQDSTPLPPLPSASMAPIDLFTMLLAHKLRYLPNERDMVVLSHEIIAKKPGPNTLEEVYTSSLITYGTPQSSAMARTVGLPVAFAALNVLDGKVHLRGVSGPGDRSIYEPVLEGLQQVGLGMTESTSVLKETVESALIQPRDVQGGIRPSAREEGSDWTAQK